MFWVEKGAKMGFHWINWDLNIKKSSILVENSVILWEKTQKFSKKLSLSEALAYKVLQNFGEKKSLGSHHYNARNAKTIDKQYR